MTATPQRWRRRRSSESSAEHVPMRVPLERRGSDASMAPSASSSLESYEAPQIEPPEKQKMAGAPGEESPHTYEDLLHSISREEQDNLHDTSFLRRRQEDKKKKHKAIKTAAKRKAFKEWHWGVNAENIFGAFIHTAMHEGCLHAVKKCGAALTLCTIIQFTFAWELWNSMPPLLDLPASGFCVNPGLLQVSACCVFLLIMTGNIPQMQRSMLITLFATVKEYDDRHHRITLSLPGRIFVFVCGGLFEYLSWFCVLCAGVYWIFTAPDVNNIIRSTVSIAFVTNIDEMMYSAVTPVPIKHSLTSTKYFLRHRVLWCGLREQQVFWLTYKYGAYAHLPAIFLLPFLLVMSLRSSRGVENGCTSLQSADFDNIFWSKLVSGWIFGEDTQAPQSWL